MFVSWCTYHEGLSRGRPRPAGVNGQGFAYTPAGARSFQQHGRWTRQPELGHIAFFDFPEDGVNRISHVGSITMEGNADERGGRTGGKAMRKARRTGIVGYGIPHYDGIAGNGGSGGLPPYRRELRAGARNQQVKLVQGRLVQVRVARLAVDGDFATDRGGRREVPAPQGGLAAGGIVGPRSGALWT